MNSKRFGFLILLIVCCLPTTRQFAQETTDEPNMNFEKVYAQWNSLDEKISEVIKTFREAESAEDRESLTQKYDELVSESRTLLPVLEQAALQAFKAAPNQNENVTESLVGIVANYLRLDQYEETLKLAGMMIDNDCPEEILDTFVGMAAYCMDDFDTAEDHFAKAKANDVLTAASQSAMDDLPTAKEGWLLETGIRNKEATANDLPRVELETTKGMIVLELYENEAPMAVANFVNLVDSGFYDGLTFHRVLGGFMAQGGCPDGSGGGGPGYLIPCECYEEGFRRHFRGTLSMAHAGRNTGGSQFFLTFKRTPHLDGKHTVFGRVIEGLDVLANLQRRNPSQGGQTVEPDKITNAKVLRKRDHDYLPTKVGQDDK